MATKKVTNDKKNPTSKKKVKVHDLPKSFKALIEEQERQVKGGAVARPGADLSN
jgi:hypothetical protein